MRFPDSIVILRPSGLDAYGNPGGSFTNAAEIPARAFIVQRSQGNSSVTVALMPPDTDITGTDRIRRGTTTYALVGEVITARSPSKAVLKTATLQEVGNA
jgi:hypothetical protein